MGETWFLEVDYACACGMAHYHQFRFSSPRALVHWLLAENTNVDKIHNITVTRHG